MDKSLILTADDFGAHPCIDQGIIEGIEAGVINTISAFGNFSDSPDKIAVVRSKFPDVAIGVHLNITSGPPKLNPDQIPSLVDKDGQFYEIERLLGKIDNVDPTELSLELEAQVIHFLSSGSPLDHLSIHHNSIIFRPKLFKLLIALAKKYHAPLRNPLPISRENAKLFGDAGTLKKGRKIGLEVFFRSPIQALKSIPYTSKKWMQRLTEDLNSASLIYPDHMIDYIYGSPTKETISHIFSNLPSGVSELVFHLGKNCNPTGFPKGIDISYLPNREKELELVQSGLIQEFIKGENIKTHSFSELNNNGKAYQ